MAVDVNSKAPVFNLLNTKRESVTLGDLKGKKAVLAFFPAAFTGVCAKELCTFQDSMAELNGLNAVVVGISADSPFANGAFAEKNKLEYPILSDYNRAAINAYGVGHDDFVGMAGYTAAKRSIFVLNTEGTVIYKWVSDDPGKEPLYDEIKAVLAK
ncbi:MAG: peroxiredoxin [Nitrospiraceae bacterium]|nr:peroxiredoxin [Nitrospiraceae bacterium]|tara:strand:- start:250 stop:717 length:468 start_codon:yes stop_codon:yes gene_type:complete